MTTTHVAALLDRFARAWQELDGDQVLSCFANSPTTTVIGTDEGEYFEGWEAYAQSWSSGRPSHVDKFSWGDSRHIDVVGDVAWSHGVIDFDITSTAARVSGSMWITCVSRRVAGRWLISHLHASFTAPVHFVV